MNGVLARHHLRSLRLAILRLHRNAHKHNTAVINMSTDAIRNQNGRQSRQVRNTKPLGQFPHLVGQAAEPKKLQWKRESSSHAPWSLSFPTFIRRRKSEELHNLPSRAHFQLALVDKRRRGGCRLLQGLYCLQPAMT